MRMETQRHVQSVHPNLYGLTVVHPYGSLLPTAASTDLFLVIGVADSIVYGGSVVIDAGG
jgi:sorbitol-specific phosphotransferase system component IIC